VTPTERLKTALIDARARSPRFTSALHATRLLIAEQGVGTLYRGLASTTLKQAATSAVRMGSYNALKGLAERYGGCGYGFCDAAVWYG
jgi:solute carrier family 25 (mitochondrial citrate transporter), member 1